MRLAVVLLAGSGCSQIFGLSSPVHDDAAVTVDDAEIDTVVADAPPDVFDPSCMGRWLSPQGPTFTAPASLSFNGATDDLLPVVTPDGLEILFERTGEVFQGTRTTTAVGFSGINRVGSLSTASGEGKAWQSSNRLRAFVASARNGGSGGFDIWRGARATEGQPFSTDQTYLENVNTAAAETDPHVTPGQLHLYFVQAGRISLATRATATDSFSAPTQLTELVGTQGVEQSPSVTGDERVIVFASSRSGTSYDLYYATRASASVPFGAPKLLAISTGSADHSPDISEDGCTLYFASDRDAAGNLDLYVTTVVN